MRSVPTGVSALLLACIATSALEAQSPPAARTIRYPTAASAPVTALATPAFTLDPAACELNRANAVLIQSNGGLVVVNAGNLELCFFDPRGRFVKKIGRQGQGPGEFVEMYWPSLYRGDSVVITDRLQARVTVLGPTGDRGREFVVLKPDTLGSQTLTVPLANGDFLLGFSEIRTAAPRPDAVVIHQQIIRVGPEGGRGPRVARLPASEHFIQKAPPEMGGTAYWSLAFGRTLSVSPSSLGFIFGDGSDDVIRELDANGNVRVLHTTGLARLPVTPAMIAEYKETEIKSARPERLRIIESLVKEMPYPTHLPVYRRVVADPAGPVWLNPVDAGASRWIRLNPADASARAFRFPQRFTPYAARGERICGIGRDDDDVQTVYCFDVPRGR